jgi:hypothetical protein
MVSLDLPHVSESNTFMSVLMSCVSDWMYSALLDPNGGQRWVVYDEARRLRSHPSLLRGMDAHRRLARHYGIANLFVFRNESDQLAITATMLNLTGTEKKMLRPLGTG